MRRGGAKNTPSRPKSTGTIFSVAQHCTISYIAPSQVGDVLTVTIKRRSQGGTRRHLRRRGRRVGERKPIAEFLGISLPQR